MRPYLAILRDSFREAVASRTLPFLLVFFTIVLLALAPLGLREEVPWRLRPTDLADVRLLAMKLRSEGTAESDQPAKRVLDRLPEDLRQRLIDPDELADDQPPQDNPFGPTTLQRNLADALNNHVLRDADFYSETAWKGRNLSEEAKSLLGRGVKHLSEEELLRLNRLLFESAFPAAVMSAPEASAELTWFGGDIPLLTDALRQASVDKSEVQRQAQDLLRVVSSWIVGPIGLLVAIFVTSTIIPRMFEAGAIDLLLSKPISRTGLYLTRFFSGCAFVLITFSYFIAGLWLIAGLRLDIWNNGLLLAIPLLLFTFAVIYSISAAAGVVWRNPIVSVLAAVLFWGLGFAVGVSRDAMATFRNGDKTRQIVPAGESIIVSDKNGRVYEWSSSANDWTLIFEGPQRQVIAGLVYPLLGPVYDPTRDQLIAADIGPGGTNRLLIGTRASGWERSEGAVLPPATQSIFVTNEGRLLAVGQAGLFRFEGDPRAKTATWGFWGLNFAPKDTDNVFVRIDDDASTSWGRDVAAAVDQRSGIIIAADQGHLVRYEPTAEGYRMSSERKLETEEPAVLGVGGGRLIAAFADGTVRIFDSKTLQDVASFRRDDDDDPPRTAEMSPDGRWAAVLTHGGMLTLYDARDGRPIDRQVRGQADISAVAFAPDGSLWVSDRLKRLTRYDAKSLEPRETYEGRLTRLEFTYRYVLRPLGWLLPNTYGLRNAETYLFTDRKTEAVEGPDARLESERLTYDVWGPIWQNGIFLAVVLGLTCFYISRKDF